MARRFDASAAAVEEKTLVEQIDAWDRSLAPSFAAAQSSVDGYNPGMAARTLNREVAPVHAAWLRALDELTQLQNQRIAAEIQGLSQRAARIDAVIGTVAVLASLLAAYVGWRLTLSITRPLRQAVDFAAAVSIGLAALCDARDSTPADLLRAADQAMYDAKHGGRNQVRQRALACCTTDAVAP